MLTLSHLIQIAVALVPVVGLLVLAADRMSSQKSVTMNTIIKVIALSLLPAITIVAMHGLLTSPVVVGFLGIMTGFVLANLVSGD